MRVALGTAIVLGFAKGKMECAPTTAHLLLGKKCGHSCSYCDADDSKIARIEWPEFPDEMVLASSFEPFERVCLQLTSSGLDAALRLIPAFAKPVSVSIRTTERKDVERLFAAGAQRVCIPLDGCTPEASENANRGGFGAALGLLEWAAQKFPGRVSTHLIIGLGETEKDAVELLWKLHLLGICAGLFAFTPVKGTSFEKRPKPHIGAYRRIQTARYQIEQAKSNAGFRYNSRDQLVALPDTDGNAFRTSGCAGCNRPHFDSSGHKVYNFPRPLTEDENQAAQAQARIYLGTSIRKADKLVRIRLEYSDIIESVEITGDFYAYPEEAIANTEKELAGCRLEKAAVLKRVDQALKNIDVFGFDAQALTDAIMGAVA